MHKERKSYDFKIVLQGFCYVQVWDSSPSHLLKEHHGRVTERSSPRMSRPTRNVKINVE